MSRSCRRPAATSDATSPAHRSCWPGARTASCGVSTTPAATGGHRWCGTSAARHAGSPASSTRGATTWPANSCRSRRAGLRRSRQERAGPAAGALRGVGWLVLREPRSGCRAAAGLPRSDPPPPAGVGGRAVPGDRRQAGRPRLQLEDPGGGVPGGVPRPHDPPEDRRSEPRHPGHGDHAVRPRPPVDAVTGHPRGSRRQPRAAPDVRGRHRALHARRHPTGPRHLPERRLPLRRPRLPDSGVLAASPSTGPGSTSSGSPPTGARATCLRLTPRSGSTDSRGSTP